MTAGAGGEDAVAGAEGFFALGVAAGGGLWAAAGSGALSSATSLLLAGCNALLIAQPSIADRLLGAVIFAAM